MKQFINSFLGLLTLEMLRFGYYWLAIIAIIIAFFFNFLNYVWRANGFDLELKNKILYHRFEANKKSIDKKLKKIRGNEI